LTVEKLSKRQAEVIDYIKKYISENGYSPALSDIARGLNLHGSTIVAHITALKRKGFLKSDYRVARSIQIIYPETVTEKDMNTDGKETEIKTTANIQRHCLIATKKRIIGPYGSEANIQLNISSRRTGRGEKQMAEKQTEAEGKNPWAKDSRNLTEQARILKENPKMAELLKQEAETEQGAPEPARPALSKQQNCALFAGSLQKKRKALGVWARG